METNVWLEKVESIGGKVIMEPSMPTKSSQWLEVGCEMGSSKQTSTRTNIVWRDQNGEE